MKKTILLFVLLLLPVISASLYGTVRNDQGVALVGATVEVIGGEGMVGTTRVISGGGYSIDVGDGVYFLNVSESSYPTVILLVSVTGQTSVDVIMAKNPPSCIYGIVAYNESLSGMKAYALRNGRMSSYAQIQQNGMYLLSGLDDGAYNVTVTQGDYDAVLETVSLQKSQCAMVGIELKKKEEKKENATKFELVAPENVSVGERITISLLENGLPAQNRTITVNTPKGELTVVTDENGMAGVYAADAGDYSFAFENITKTTKAETKGIKEENATGEITPKPEAEKKEPAWGLYALSILIGVIVFLLLLFLLRPKKEEKPAEAKGEMAKPEEKEIKEGKQEKKEEKGEEKPVEELEKKERKKGKGKKK
jgi:hypothetical protein